MRLLAISQRVAVVEAYAERRDALDQRWAPFVERLGAVPLLVPNRAESARELCALDPAAVLLTGGNTLAAYGGDAPERDATETLLLEWAIAKRRPVLGVCRGLQLILHHFGARLGPVAGHVGRHTITFEGARREVNSYHELGATEAPEALEVLARADDGVIEAARHRALPILGIMWHPEREAAFAERDLSWFRSHLFGGDA